MTADDARLLAIAWRQHGAFSVDQAAGSGFTVDQVRRRVRTGRWQRPVRGVLVLAGSPDTWHRRAWVALLARPDGVLSHLAAGRAAGLVDGAPPIELTVPRRTAARSPVARLHRRDLRDAERTVVDGLACTTAARTIVDLAPIVGRRQVARMVDLALQQGRASTGGLAAALHATPQLPRSARGAVLHAMQVWQPVVRPASIGEARLLRQLDEWGIERPDRQVPVLDRDGTVVARVDMAGHSSASGSSTTASTGTGRRVGPTTRPGTSSWCRWDGPSSTSTASTSCPDHPCERGSSPPIAGSRDGSSHATLTATRAGAAAKRTFGRTVEPLRNGPGRRTKRA